MKHYDVSYAVQEVAYKGKPGGNTNLPPRNDQHVERILNLYQAAIRQEEEELQRANVQQPREGYYLRFQNAPDFDFALDSLDSKRIGHIVSVKEEKDETGKSVTSAILYLKKDKKDWLDDKAEEYKTKKTDKGNKKNAALIDSIESIVPVGMDSLWTGKGNMPTVAKEWVELWFKGANATAAKHLLKNLSIEYKEGSLEFPERVVVLAYANRKDLEQVFFASNTLVRISEAPTLAGFIADEQGPQQMEWLDMIKDQFRYDRISNKYLCLLDSGVKPEHPLLAPVITQAECYVVDPNWGKNDVAHHGTPMAGLAVYGDLMDVLGRGPIMEPRYRLCSVKLLPSSGEVLKENWGNFTKQAVSTVEIDHPNDVMAYCMAVAEVNGYTDGVPSSWSSAVDQICSGVDGQYRLFIQCAGNIDHEQDFVQYPNSNRIRGVVNPGQAWNALTVGAYTRKHVAMDDNGQQMEVVARMDGLSPYSTTSALWAQQTPIKPEVVMEGGNRTKGPLGTDRHRDLELLTTATSYYINRPFTLFNATSAATAQAARFAAVVMAENPNYWPETVRGLFVHTAQWTDQMVADYPDKDERLRICGYGVPDLEKMLNSRRNGVTFISQRTIQPYKKEKGNPAFNWMHLYTLPWPKDTLLDLGDREVKLTITLSYFVEPGPTDNFTSSFKKYNYASAGLRFDLNTEVEDEEMFMKRILRSYDKEKDELRPDNDTGRWEVQITKRTKGSVHKDWIKTTAAQLATCNMIAVFPVSGWWYKRTSMRKVEAEMRYSLIVSLECGEEQVNFSTEIENKIPIEQQVQIEI